ncbi:hypothetical protein C7M84_003829 [Penaeus vannamei]|uniref:Uncharacterized protein n=1 Tax=Penaeus vannamei TaxID=6689 RepID=A0A423TM46_PENVA|nr:hypothetical protein C7M84_003829 [Penaeus vannamei]
MMVKVLVLALALVGVVHADKMFSPPAPPAPGYSYGAPDLRARRLHSRPAGTGPHRRPGSQHPRRRRPWRGLPHPGLRPRHRILLRGTSSQATTLTPPRRPAAKCSTSASSTAARTPSCAPTALSSTSSTSCATGGSTWTAPRPTVPKSQPDSRSKTLSADDDRGARSHGTPRHLPQSPPNCTTVPTDSKFTEDIL